MPDDRTAARIEKRDAVASDAGGAAVDGDDKKLPQRLKGIAIDACFGLTGDFDRTDFWSDDYGQAFIDHCRRKTKPVK